MTEITHRVKVFVFQFTEEIPHYLMLRAKPRQENFWGPVMGTIRPWEDLDRAILREVREETGLDRPEEVVDLEIRDVWTMGEEHLVDWMYGFRVRPAQLTLGDGVSEFQWVPFPRCYESLETETNRKGLIRLHTMLDAG